MIITLTDTTDTRRPSITVIAGTARITRGTLIIGNVRAIHGATEQETADGNRIAHERAAEWAADLDRVRALGGTDRLALSVPDYAADFVA